MDRSSGGCCGPCGGKHDMAEFMFFGGVSLFGPQSATRAWSQTAVAAYQSLTKGIRIHADGRPHLLRWRLALTPPTVSSCDTNAWRIPCVKKARAHTDTRTRTRTRTHTRTHTHTHTHARTHFSFSCISFTLLSLLRYLLFPPLPSPPLPFPSLPFPFLCFPLLSCLL